MADMPQKPTRESVTSPATVFQGGRGPGTGRLGPRQAGPWVMCDESRLTELDT